MIGQKMLREKLGINVMAQLKASVLKARGCQDDSGMELTALAAGQYNAGAVQRAAMVTRCLSRRSGQSSRRQVTWKMR